MKKIYIVQFAYDSYDCATNMCAFESEELAREYIRSKEEEAGDGILWVEELDFISSNE